MRIWGFWASPRSKLYRRTRSPAGAPSPPSHRLCLLYSTVLRLVLTIRTTARRSRSLGHRALVPWDQALTLRSGSSEDEDGWRSRFWLDCSLPVRRDRPESRLGAAHVRTSVRERNRTFAGRSIPGRSPRLPPSLPLPPFRGTPQAHLP